MPTIIATPKDGNANSYLTLALANAFFNDTLRESVWEGFDDADKQRALIQATREIESLRLAGEPYDTSTPQALHFPRKGEEYRTSVEEDFTSSYGVAVSLGRTVIVSGSETVETTDGATEYTKDTDYTMGYAAGTITVLAAGSMADDTEYHITYDYEAAPEAIEDALCEQALWLLQKTLAADLIDREALQQQGVASISIDGHSESYRGYRERVLGPKAQRLMEPYILRIGKVMPRGRTAAYSKPSPIAEPD
jgi:hypothetical protein